MGKFIKSKLRLIIGVLSAAVVIALIILNTQSHTPPKLVAATPADQSKNVLLLSPLILQFDIPITTTDFVITSDPTNTWTVAQKASTIITVEHAFPLKPNVDYTIKAIWKGKEVADVTFHTQQSETDYELLDKLHAEIKNKYPLAAKLPYETNNYSVVYSAELTLGITPKATALSEEEMLAQVKDWVKQNGVDPATHQYKFAEPSP